MGTARRLDGAAEAPSVSNSSHSPSLGDVVSASGFAVALVTAWLYTAGWSYAYHYFDRFRIPLLMVDLPFEHYLIYGSLVIWKNLLIVALVATLAIAIAWAFIRWATKLGRFRISALLVLLVLGMFALARFGGIAAARTDFLQQRLSDYAAYPRVALALKKDLAANLGSQLADLPGTDCGRLVLVSGGRLFLIRPIRGAAGTDLDSFIIPADQVEALRISSEYGSCP